MDSDIKQHIALGENATVEFKESFNRETIQTAAAFANTDGGVIFIGVSDRQEIKGISIGKETLRDLSNRISQATEPRVPPELQVVDVEGHSVLLIRITECSIKPVSVKGVCYKRVGNSNHVMSPQEIAQMHLKSVGQTWDQLLAVNARPNDMDAQKVQWYLTRREAIRNVAKPKDMGITELLRNINSISSDGTPTKAGILCFGKQPQRFFQNAQLRVVRFKGNSVPSSH